MDDFKEREVEVWLAYHKINPATAVVRPGLQAPCPHLYAVTYDGDYVRMFMDYIPGQYWKRIQIYLSTNGNTRNFCQFRMVFLNEWNSRSAYMQLWWLTEGLFIESLSGSAVYSAEMLTEGANSWQVEDESTLAPLVNIEAEYAALADHKEIA